MTLFDDVLATIPDDVGRRDDAGPTIDPPFVIVRDAGGEKTDGRLFSIVELDCYGAFESDKDAERLASNFTARMAKLLDMNSAIMTVEDWDAPVEDTITDATVTQTYLLSTITVRSPL